jgi:hypothetical protein
LYFSKSLHLTVYVWWFPNYSLDKR